MNGGADFAGMGMGVNAMHKAGLETLLSTFGTAVALEMRCDLADAPTDEPHNRETFRAHFARLSMSLERWNTAIEQADATSEALWRRLASSAREHGLSEPPFMVGALIDHLATRTLEQPRRAHGMDVKELVQHFNDRVAGIPHVSVYMMGRRVAMLPGGSQPDVQRRIDAAYSLIKALFDEASVCPEAAQAAAARDELFDLKQRLLNDRARSTALESIAFSPTCPHCEGLLAAASATPMRLHSTQLGRSPRP